MRRALVLGVIAVALAGLGCTRANPAYCDEDTPCRNGGVCDLTLNSCSPGDAGVDAPAPHDGGDAGGDGGGDAGGDAASACTQSSACTDPAKPICDGTTCQPCGGDGECLARDPATPACVSGRCYECSIYGHCPTAGRPLCAADHTCQACTRDLECKDGPTPTVGVCVAGACPGADAVLWVAASDGGCPGNGSAATPFCAITDAVTAALTDARKAIVVKPGTYGGFSVKSSALAGLTVVGQIDVAGVPTVTGSTSAPAVDVDLVGAVTLRRLHLVGGGAASGSTAVLQCYSAACTGEELDIEAGGIGLKASAAAPLKLARSRVHDNLAGGVFVGGSSSYVIENNFIYGNGTLAASLGGVLFSASFTTTRFVNNTLFANRSLSGIGAGIHCDVGTIVTTNNILWDNRNGAGLAEVNKTAAIPAVPICTVSYSVIDDAEIAGAVGAHNTGDNPAFAKSDLPPYNLHLTAASGGALGGANPAEAPSDDIDGQPRPPGGPTDIGADQRSQ